MHRQSDGESIMLVSIQPFSIHDGPGIRTVVFTKGCPLRCIWCCNPEAQGIDPDIRHNSSLCIGTAECGLCLRACPEGALYDMGNNTIGIDRELCSRCGLCASACPARALSVCGEMHSIDAVLEMLRHDQAIISKPGGLTITGGESMMFPCAVTPLLREASAMGIHIAVDTCGFFDLDSACVREALTYTNLLYYDIKHVDSAKHKQGTGLDNARILQNLDRLGREFPNLPIITRTPVIPGFNDTRAEMMDIARLVCRAPSIVRHELIPYHGWGEVKYEQLGRPRLFNAQVRKTTSLETLMEPFHEAGIQVSLA